MHQSKQSSSAHNDLEERLALTKMIMKLFDLWKLTPAEQLELLGFAPSARSTLTRYRQKGDAISNNRDLLDRVGHLLSIHKSLRIIFPHNRNLAYTWSKTRNTQFNFKTPVEIMQENGYTGLLMVRSYLDRERGK